jgi:carboxylesterase
MTIADRTIYLPGGRTGFLLIHGLGGTPVELRFIAIGLARGGHTVLCPQLAGHCGTVAELAATCWQDWYATVENAHTRLVRECDIIIVGGLSAGAILALHAAALHPKDVHGTVLFAPTLWLDGWGVPWYSRLFALVTRRWCADLFWFSEREPFGIKDERVRALVMAAIQSGDSSQAGQLSNPGGVMLELRWLVKTVRCELDTIRQPSLILHPREDDRASLRNALHLQNKLAGRAEVLVLNDSYHVITLDRQRQVVIDRTDRFAASISDPQMSSLCAPELAAMPDFKA